MNVSLYMSDKLAAKSVMPVGNCTVWNMASNLTDKCPATRRSEAEMTHSIPFSLKLELANTCQGPYLSI